MRGSLGNYLNCGGKFMIDLRDIGLGVEEIRQTLSLEPHPEGGWYRETWRDIPTDANARGVATTIFFLLAENERSAWHRVDAVEIWLWLAGTPLELQIADDAGSRMLRLGPVMSAESSPQAVVPAFSWQAARSTGAWTLVSCVVAPAFSFTGFELAPPGYVALRWQRI